MRKIVPGDLVALDGDEFVVVDTGQTDDGPSAVLRTVDDTELNRPLAVLCAELVKVGHLHSITGWTETAPGVWQKADA